MATGVVTFDESEFIGMFPEFSSTSLAVISANFLRAENLLDNSESSIVQEVDRRKILLYLATAHISALSTRGSTVVGQMSSASEGSVSASFTPLEAGSGAWWSQTQYGAEFWNSTKRYRSFFIV